MRIVYCGDFVGGYDIFELKREEMIRDMIDKFKIVPGIFGEIVELREEKHMDKVKIELYRYGRIVFGKVLYLDECLRGKGELLEIRCKNTDLIWHTSFTIDSASRPTATPELWRTGLYVWGGNKRDDNKEFYCSCDSSEEAQELCNRIVNAIQALNKNYADKLLTSKVERVL
jgi:hypothetical protein